MSNTPIFDPSQVIKILDSFCTGFWDWHIESGRFYFSDQWLRYMSYSQEDAQNTNGFWTNTIHPDDMDGLVTAMDRVIGGEADHFECEIRLCRSDKKFSYFKRRGVVTERNKSGEAIRISGTDQNIIQAKWSEAMLRSANTDLEDTIAERTRSLRLFRSLVNQSSDSLFLLEADTGLIADLNDTACRSLGYTRGELMSRPFATVSAELGNPGEWQDWVSALQNDKPSIRTTVHHSKSGETIPFEITLRKGRFDDRDYVISTARDIRERVRAEEEKAGMQAQIVQSSKLASLGTMAAGIAHELNNPLVGVIGFSGLLIRKEYPPKKVSEMAEQIQYAAQRMKKIVDHMRTYTRKSTAGDWQDVDLHSALRDSLIFLTKKLTIGQIELTMDLHKPGLVVRGDYTRLESVFQNLVNNSIDAFENVTDDRDRTIHIRTSVINGDTISFLYEDNAGGMPESIREKIFDPFFTTKEVGKGTGLGMSVVYGTIQEHNGTIDVSSEENEGTQFTITLPFFRQGSTGRPGTSAPAESVQEEAEVRLPALLVVDDDEVVIRFLAMALEGHFELTLLSDPIQAQKAISSCRYDLILTDLRMPEVSGIELLRHAKKEQPDTPVLLMTSNIGNEVDTAEATRIGARQIIAKPFDSPQNIIDIMEKCLEPDQAKKRA